MRTRIGENPKLEFPPYYNGSGTLRQSIPNRFPRASISYTARKFLRPIDFGWFI